MLFSNESRKREEAKPAAAISHSEICSTYISERISTDLAAHLPLLQNGYGYHIELDWKWCLHHVVAHCIKLIGKCELHFATYAIKNEQALMFCDMLKKNLLSEISALCDYRLPVTDPNAHDLLQRNCTHFALARTHAKLVCLRNEHTALTIVSSANFTSNTKLDVAVITVDRSVTDARIEWIKQHIDQCNLQKKN